MVFNNDPLNLAAVANKPEGCESPLTNSPVLDRSHEFEPSDVQPFDLKDPLNLNGLNDNEHILKPPRKRRKRKRRSTFNAEGEHDMNIKLDSSVLSESEFLLSPIEKNPCICLNNATDIINVSATNIVEQEDQSKTLNKEKRFGKNKTKSDNLCTVKEKSHFNERNKKYRYGNYSHYYHLNKIQDPRLSLFKKEWFENKYCLDIGCNTGFITCWVSKNYAPRHITGIDIDCALIKIAKKTARQNCVPRSKDIRRFPLSFELTYGPIGLTQLLNKKKVFPDNIKFIVVSIY